MSVTNQDFINLLEILYQSVEPSSKTSFFTKTEIEELSDVLLISLPSNLDETLRQGLKRGLFLKCALSGTEITGNPEYLYAYNPDLLRVNASNAKLLNPLCLNNHSIQGTLVTNSNNRVPCYETRGSISGQNSTVSKISCDPTNITLKNPLRSSVVQSISCCRK